MAWATRWWINWWIAAWSHSVADLYDLTVGEADGAGAHGRRNRPATSSAISRTPSRTRCRACSPRWASASWASARRCFWRRHSAAWTPSPQAGLDELQQRRRGGAQGGREHLPVLPRAAQPELVERLRAAGLQFDLRIRRGPRAGRSKGLTFVLTGTLPNLSREEAKALIESRGRQGERLGQQEDQLRGGRRGCRLETGQGAGTGHPGGRRGAVARSHQRSR